MSAQCRPAPTAGWAPWEHDFPGLYWNTLEDAPARALYDKVGKFHEGLVHYAYRRDTNQASTRR
ncbi:hypothetical protein Ppa06_12890 [Planomonospora parontospora subsp. parontospora]|uniref:Uncharacterized protein n=2 Tax=Planomonospora parontospora TaxID=58119 RepID=A0AA37BDG5_9ACTN|nr:hypothetical protein [Planomonospora parontospora]GGK54644.1 hypothetical protein GCM10010126_12690 [Planomonospora parontospora]GII07491.1 hypothetical protein Ppa06_12890 [Planomonospora parontospora subsp. parontospora]